MKNNNLGGTREMGENTGYTAGPFTVDEIGFIQIADAKVLAAVARGEIDLNRIAKEELAARGLGLHGGVGISFPDQRRSHFLRTQHPRRWERREDFQDGTKRRKGGVNTYGLKLEPRPSREKGRGRE